MFFRVITKRRGMILFLVMALILLPSCSGKDLEDRIYTQGGFSAELCWSLDESEYTAKLTAEPPAENGRDRDLTLEFISPDRLKGLRITRKDGIVTLNRGDMTAELHNQAILEAAELVCADGKFSYKTKTELSGRKVILASRVCENGNADIYLEAASGAPIRILSGEYDIEIVWFEFSNREATK